MADTEKYLVTGAAGVIGGGIVRSLVEKGKNVHAVVRKSSNTWRVDDILDRITIHDVDLLDTEQVQNLFSVLSPERVIHMAGVGIYPWEYKANRDDKNAKNAEQEDVRRKNEKMGENILYASVQNTKLKKLVGAGSVFEYGNTPGKVSELDDNTQIILNGYAASKLRLTTLYMQYASLFNMPIDVVRPFTVYGPGEDPTRVVEATILRCMAGAEIRIVPGVVRDFVYVSDVTRLALSLCDSGEAGRVVNAGSGKATTLQQLAELTKVLTGSNSEIIFDNAYIRPNESKCYANIQSARELGIKPTSLRSGLQQTIKWLKMNRDRIPTDLMARLKV